MSYEVFGSSWRYIWIQKRVKMIIGRAEIEAGTRNDLEQLLQTGHKRSDHPERVGEPAHQFLLYRPITWSGLLEWGEEPAMSKSDLQERVINPFGVL